MTTTTLDQNPTGASENSTAALPALADLVGRAGLAAIFLLAGLNKIGGYEGTQGYMASVGVPGELLPLVIFLEVVGAIFLIAGFQTRSTALALAGFSVLSGLLFHANLADQMQFILFFKNLAMAGGFLVLAANGAGAWSLDAKRGG
ncbi:MAG: DoxX family protein [Pseudomonadota bacterium]